MTPFDGGDTFYVMATAKLPPGGTIGPAPVVSRELFTEADELERLADTISARAGLLRTPGLGAEHVEELRELLVKLRAVFESRPWRERLLQFCRIEGDELRAERRISSQGLALRGRAERALNAADAPLSSSPAAHSKRIQGVENLIDAYAENIGGRGKTSAGLISERIADLFGVSVDSIRKAASRRKR